MKIKKRWRWLFIYTIPIVVYAVYPQEIKTLLFPPLVIEYDKNTTCVDYKEGMYKLNELSNLLNRYTSYTVLCMHHMDMTIFYRACKVNRYFMLEPKIQRLNGKEMTVIEQSVSCNRTFKKKRFQCVSLIWKDENLNTISGDFCSDVAINIQLSIDEFEGKKHCKDESNRPNN